MKFLVQRVILVTVFLFSVGIQSDATIAQENLGEQFCTNDEQAESLGEALSLLEAWRESDDLNADIVEVMTILQTLQTECAGYVFTSEEFGQNHVTEPITFRDGVYRLILDADPGGLSIDLTEVAGSCRPGFEGISSDEPHAETTAEMEGCTAILEFSAFQPDTVWTITYEPILVEGLDTRNTPDERSESSTSESQTQASTENIYDQDGIRFTYPDGFQTIETDNGVEVENGTGTNVTILPSAANIPNLPDAEIGIIFDTMKNSVEENGVTLSEATDISIGNYQGVQASGNVAGLVQTYVVVLRATDSDALVTAFAITTEGADIESLLLDIVESLEVDTTFLSD